MRISDWSSDVCSSDLSAIDGTLDHPLTGPVLKPLWGAWAALAKARDKREPLELDLPERRVVLDEMGRIMSVAPRERLDAHRLIEDFIDRKSTRLNSSH